MSDKINILPYRRERKKAMSIVDVQKEAHKIAFYPMMFQAVRSLINLGILPYLAAHEGQSKAEIIHHTKISEYAADLLLDLALYSEIVELKKGMYHLSKLGRFLLEDELIKVNMDFMNDVCYLGAYDLQKSFESGRPEGLKVFGNWQTVYQGLDKLPPSAQQSWFNFDNYYSDLVFDEAVKIILRHNPKLVFDVGGNTAKFDIALLNANPNVKTEIFDLSPQLKKAAQSIKQAGLENRVKINELDVLDINSSFPPGSDAIWMSQFLDCFSPEKIVFILSKLRLAMADQTRLYILEPFVDRQNEVAALALTNISLYFTCIANGYSRMYKQTEMENYLDLAGLKLVTAYQKLGDYDYTLLECMKNNGALD